MTGVLTKREYLNTDTQGRECSDAFTNQGTSKIASKLPVKRGEAWTRFSLYFSERPNPADNFNCRLLAYRTMRQ